MRSGYHIDLSMITLDDLQNSLSTEYILPSRQILKEDIDNRFEVLISMGINDLESLLNELKSKKKIEEFAVSSGLPVDYLTILRREVNSYRSKPVPFSKIPGVDEATLNSLEKVGIRNTEQLFKRGISIADRIELARETGLPDEYILDLVKMADLSRINGVGPVFIRTFLSAGVESVEMVSDSDPEGLYETLVEHYKAQGFERIDFVVRDIQWCKYMARRLPKTIEW